MCSYIEVNALIIYDMIVCLVFLLALLAFYPCESKLAFYSCQSNTNNSQLIPTLVGVPCTLAQSARIFCEQIWNVLGSQQASAESEKHTKNTSTGLVGSLTNCNNEPTKTLQPIRNI